MNTATYLKNQGWRGHGHALHHSGRGITKPIHICQKANVLGVGKKQHDAHADQWWARAFDDTLKGLNTTTNEATGKMEGIAFGSSAQALQTVGIGEAKWAGQGGLYSNFVRGETLGGTLTPGEEDHRETQSQAEDQRKRKRGSNSIDLTAPTALTVPTAEDGQRSKKERWRKVDFAEDSKLEDVDAQLKFKDVGTEKVHQEQGGRPKDTEVKKQRGQRKRERKARGGLEAGERREM